MGNSSDKEVVNDVSTEKIINIYPTPKDIKKSDSDSSLDDQSCASYFSEGDNDGVMVEHSYDKSLFDIKVKTITKIKDNVYEFDAGYELEAPPGYLIAICPHMRLAKYGMRMTSGSIIKDKKSCKICVRQQARTRIFLS